MRDWAKSLRPASYRGVPFWVDFDDFSGGKRLAQHQTAGGRVTVIEEMGLKTPTIDVTAYLIGDTSDLQGKVLTVACLAPEAGRLVLPIDGGMMAYVEEFRRSREKDRRGYIAFSFSAIPKSSAIGTSIGIGDVLSAVATGISGAATALSRLF